MPVFPFRRPSALRARSASTSGRFSPTPVPAAFALASLFIFGIHGCGGDGGPTDPPPPPPPPENPAPSVSGISPNSAEAGSDGFTLTVSGSGFVQGSTVHWNGSSRTTTFGSATQLTASIAAGDVASAGSAQVTVVTAAPGGGTSQAASFAIEPASVASVDVDPESASLVVGETVELSATPRAASGAALTDRAVSWESDDLEVADVNEDGIVTAIAPGTATITATSEGVSGEATIDVSLVPVATVEIDPESGSMIVGETLQLTATPLDEDGSALDGREIAWESDDPDVAEVDGDGLVTAIAPGSATITATSEGVSGEAVVEVSLVPVATVEVEPAEAAIEVDATLQLTATPLDEDGIPLEDREVTWESDDPDVAEVDEDGLVIAIAPGTATITATSEGVSGEATIVVTEPVEPTYSTISVGDRHTCALRPDGVGYCWGGPDGGALGNGTTDTRYRPFPISGNHRFTSISASINVTCATTEGGQGWCWGSNFDGQLGDGTRTDRATPTQVAGSHSFRTIAEGNGNFHVCGVTTAGQGLCWGWGAFGQLGNGTTTTYDVPVPVSGSHTFRSITPGGGFGFTCGLTEAGEAWCWGENDVGQLGNGGTANRISPVRVSGNHTFTTLGTGGGHSCALDEDGAAWCWGMGHRGRLGDGTTNNRRNPVRVLGEHIFVSLAVGFSHNCALKEDGTTWCWGDGRQGELGDGMELDRSTPVQVEGGHRFTFLAAGSARSCALDAAGDAWCWGTNWLGGIGDGLEDENNRPVPVRVADPEHP